MSCLCMPMCHMCVVPSESRRRHQTAWDWRQLMVVGCHMGAGNPAPSSARVVNALFLYAKFIFVFILFVFSSGWARWLCRYGAFGLCSVLVIDILPCPLPSTLAPLYLCSSPQMNPYTYLYLCMSIYSKDHSKESENRMKANLFNVKGI